MHAKAWADPYYQVDYVYDGSQQICLNCHIPLDNKGNIIKEKIYKMKRYIFWRPFIVEIKDTRLPYDKSREFTFEFRLGSENPPLVLDVTVRYHRLDEKRRQKIGFKNKKPIAYSIYKHSIHL